MDIIRYNVLGGKRLAAWRKFMEELGLTVSEDADFTVLLMDENTIAASGSLSGNIFKYIGVDEMYQGQGLTPVIITELRREAFSRGLPHLFLYTKPRNKQMFQSLFFYPVAETENALLMENVEDGIENFVSGLLSHKGGNRVGSIVMNCNPFTLGHRYLIESAANECDSLHIFVLSEDKSFFPTEDRYKMVVNGTKDLGNVFVHQTGPYMISSATFPGYFLKEPSEKVNIQCELDAEVFCKWFVPQLNITHRYVGTEPFSDVTSEYNKTLHRKLPEYGVMVKEIVRKESDGVPISAGLVRKIIEGGDAKELQKYLPESTIDYLISKKYIGGA